MVLCDAVIAVWTARGEEACRGIEGRVYPWGNKFDAKRATFESRARELYLVDRKKFEIPEQVSASHILLSIDKHAKDDGLKLAQDARARIELRRALHEHAGAAGGHVPAVPAHDRTHSTQRYRDDRGC